MYHRPISEDPLMDPDAATDTPLRGFLIAAPLALGFWLVVALAAAYLI